MANERDAIEESPTDTPRTDEAEVCQSHFSDWGYGPSGYVPVEFARELERELAAQSETATPKPAGERCEACKGRGKKEYIAGALDDCGQCGGSGWIYSPFASLSATAPTASEDEIKKVLQDACDRSWEDENLWQTANIAANAIYWRDREIEKLRAARSSMAAKEHVELARQLDHVAYNILAPGNTIGGTESRIVTRAARLIESLAAPSATATKEVWRVENDTSAATFATEDDAKKYVASFGAATAGGMFISRIPVCTFNAVDRTSA